ncbi:alcohol dehydrogenase catalytic domain-containing protein [[Actinomadura] parvosata]|uniref:alcohol dehydrogenase catalytic domain-containing protein n=1 Tax=[Actinomadura] parvosata TaxID=1955412 RepID=UPI003B96DF73
MAQRGPWRRRRRPASGGLVLVGVVASAVNPVDDKTREGAIGEGAPPPPMILGGELAGQVKGRT